MHIRLHWKDMFVWYVYYYHKSHELLLNKTKMHKTFFLALSLCDINNGDCQHGAECNVVNQQVLCNCQSGFNGPQCQFGKIKQIKRSVTNTFINLFFPVLDIDECDIPAPVCQNNGVCENNF